MFPKPLKPGSKVAIAAPARKVTLKEMQFAIDWLKDKGFVPVYDDRLFAEHYIFAGDDDFRAPVVVDVSHDRNLHDRDFATVDFRKFVGRQGAQIVNPQIAVVSVNEFVFPVRIEVKEGGCVGIRVLVDG